MNEDGDASKRAVERAFATHGMDVAWIDGRGAVRGMRSMILGGAGQDGSRMLMRQPGPSEGGRVEMLQLREIDGEPSMQTMIELAMLAYRVRMTAEREDALGEREEKGPDGNAASAAPAWSLRVHPIMLAAIARTAVGPDEYLASFEWTSGPGGWRGVSPRWEGHTLLRHGCHLMPVSIATVGAGATGHGATLVRMEDERGGGAHVLRMTIDREMPDTAIQALTQVPVADVVAMAGLDGRVRATAAVQGVDGGTGHRTIELTLAEAGVALTEDEGDRRWLML